MKKTVTDDLTIVTENGVATTTKATYKVDWLLKPTTPLPNGFDREAAVYVANILISIAKVGENETFTAWDQGSWRSIWWDVDEAKEAYSYTGIGKRAEAISNLLPIELEQDTRCGTAMCMAGWVSEVTAVDWVVDAALMAKPGAVDRQEMGRWEDIMLVRKDWLDTLDLDTLDPDLRHIVAREDWTDAYGNEMSTDLEAHLRGRGFSPETHGVMSVANYAGVRLGISTKAGILDPIGMFGGSNTIADILACIDVYSRWGVEALWRTTTYRIAEPGDPTVTELSDYRIERWHHYDAMGDSKVIEAEYQEPVDA